MTNPNSKDSWLKKLGPGLITGAADDDPSGIATYSQAGAQFAFNLLWALFLTYPLMVGIQFVITVRLKRLGWLCTGVMAVALLAMIFTLGK
jgi:Mn2+/Fe2+ NRAMP family transporter